MLRFGYGYGLDRLTVNRERSERYIINQSIIMSSELSNAEGRMKAIEDRLTALEVTPSGGSNNSAAIEEAVRAYQVQVLGKLKAVREALASEGGDINTIRDERDKALQENAQLKKEIQRLNYRVNHLIKALNEEEERNK
jgi:hypothetical protein